MRSAKMRNGRAVLYSSAYNVNSLQRKDSRVHTEIFFNGRRCSNLTDVFEHGGRVVFIERF